MSTERTNRLLSPDMLECVLENVAKQHSHVDEGALRGHIEAQGEQLREAQEALTEVGRLLRLAPSSTQYLQMARDIIDAALVEPGDFAVRPLDSFLAEARGRLSTDLFSSVADELVEPGSASEQALEVPRLSPPGSPEEAKGDGERGRSGQVLDCPDCERRRLVALLRSAALTPQSAPTTENEG